LEYDPVRSGSLAPIVCLNSSVTASLGPRGAPGEQVERARREPTLLNAVPVVSALVPRRLKRLGQRERAVDQVAGATVDGSAHAQQRVTRRRDHVRARLREVVLATPGVNAPNDAAGRASATASPAPCRRRPPVGRDRRSNACTSSCRRLERDQRRAAGRQLRVRAASSGIEIVACRRVTATFTSRTTRPLMSGDHGGIAAVGERAGREPVVRASAWTGSSC
jgi:hypothetical protein